MDLIHKIESLRYDIENGVETDVIKISVRLIQIKDQALQLQQTGVSNRLLSEKIIIALDEYGRKTHKIEYGLPIDPDTKNFDDKHPKEMLKIVTDILNGC